MSISIVYRRISEVTLNAFICKDNDDEIHTSLEKTYDPYLFTIQHTRIYWYHYIHQLLVSNSKYSQILRHVIHGAKPFNPTEDASDENMYLYHLYFLTHSQVNEIVQALRTIDIGDIAAFIAKELQQEEMDMLQLGKEPLFQDVMQDFKEVVTLFQIADALQEGIIRYYVD